MPPKKFSNNKGSNGSNNSKENSSNRNENSNSEKKFTGAIPELPVLKYVSGKGTSNFYEFKEAMITYAFRQYGDLARSLQMTNGEAEYYVPPEINNPVILVPPLDEDGEADENPFSELNDPMGFVKMEIGELRKARARKIAKMMDDRPVGILDSHLCFSK